MEKSNKKLNISTSKETGNRFERFVEYSDEIGFTAYMRKMKKKPRTQYKYLYLLSHFDIEVLEGLKTKNDIQRLNQFMNTGFCGRFSFARNIAMVSSALKLYLRFKGNAELGYSLDIPPRDKRGYIDIYYSNSKLSALISACESERDTLMIKVASQVGIRIGEILQMRPEWLNFNELEITIPKDVAKGKRQHVANMSEGISKELKKFIADNKIKKNQIIFDYKIPSEKKSNRIPKPFNKEIRLERLEGYICGLFDKWCRKARIQTISPHKLRHHVAGAMRKAGATTEDIMLQLGHQDQKTTMIYSSPSKETAKKAYHKAMG